MTTIPQAADAERALARLSALRQRLPIDGLLPDVVRALQSADCVVIEAPPGAGKTTRVPHLLLELFPVGEIVVLEPRRLAAHLSAARVAEERGEALGQTVGVTVRYSNIAGPSTRLRFVTEGVLLRRLLGNPQLAGIAAVVIDEFHERHLHGDLLLSLLLKMRATTRPDLKLCVMSATLPGAALATFLGDCPVVRSDGRMFPVEITYLKERSDDPLSIKVRAALREVLRPPVDVDGDMAGDVLVFLPGSGEIRRCQRDLAELASERGLDLLPLHGDLPLEDQRAAVTGRAAAGRRKVILSTNVAETSITVSGVTAVIDSGLVRIAAHAPWSGLPTLRVQSICRASAAQRAGRAGRTRPGRCLRLYTRLDHDARPEFEVPEIQRADLCEFLLFLGVQGLAPSELRFLDAPPPAALEAARQLLVRLGALADGDAMVTALGRQLAGLPVHPRLARLLLAGLERGIADEAATIATLLGERDLRLSERRRLFGEDGATDFGGLGPSESRAATEKSDLVALYELFLQAAGARFERQTLVRRGIDPDAAQAVDRGRRMLLSATTELPRGARPHKPEAREEALMQATLCAFPDRVARRQRGGRDEGQGAALALAGGGLARLSQKSLVREAELLVLPDVEDRDNTPGRVPTARLASAIAADWLLELPPTSLGGVRETEAVVWNAESERIEVTRRLHYDQLVLDESRLPGRGDDPAQQALLLERVLHAELRMFADAEAVPRFLLRVNLLAEHAQELGLRPLTSDDVRAAAQALCAGHTSFAELRGLSLTHELSTRLGTSGSGLAEKLARLLPDAISLPSGRRAKIHYAEGQAPWVESRLQDFFGLRDGPRIAAGRLPLVLHLLAPNQRAVQVTTDLAGFWTRHYPAIRRELARRYPRHAWPEDPLQSCNASEGTTGKR